jgi:hypothetical protein
VDTELVKWIIGGMAAGYVALAVYIAKLHANINQMLQDRLKSAEEKLALLDMLKNNHGGSSSGGPGQ